MAILTSTGAVLGMSDPRSVNNMWGFVTENSGSSTILKYRSFQNFVRKIDLDHVVPNCRRNPSTNSELSKSDINFS